LFFVRVSHPLHIEMIIVNYKIFYKFVAALNVDIEAFVC
jgi:hypothetical protein